MVFRGDGEPLDMRMPCALAMPRSLEHRAGGLDSDEGVDARREADREVARACAKLEHTTRVQSEQWLEDREGLRRIWRPVPVRGRDLLVEELSSVLGREVLRLGSAGHFVLRFALVLAVRLALGFTRSGSFADPVSRFHSSNVSLEILPLTKSSANFLRCA
jgi:hypothetical protein